MKEIRFWFVIINLMIFIINDLCEVYKIEVKWIKINNLKEKIFVCIM